ncbi:anion exchange protein 3-like isoform X3 [Acanthaster planci]|uniref:Anion exchange protein n=1 Tax=Acanthaster planci TaxID=133434 RepID=A0A8B7ZA21_ACAPL|nr:anion exchange protein 3-like isoform X3 [Acanthaster planci]
MHTTDEDKYVLVPSENDKTEEDTVVQMSEKPSKSRVDHDEIEKLLGDVPLRQNFSQQLYCPSDFDTEATGRYNRRFSEYDFHSHRATPSLSHRTHYRKSLREPYRDGGLQWRRSVTVHGVPKNSRRFSLGRDVPENSLSGNTPGLTKSQTAEEPLTLIEESDVTNHQKEYQQGQEEEVDNEAGIVLKTRNRDKDGEVEESDVEEDKEDEDGKKRDGKLLDLRIKEDDEKSQQGEHEGQDEAEERLKRLSPVYTPSASYRKSKRHKPSRLHSPPLHAETRQDEGFSDNGPASPQQLSEVTDLEEACSLDQHALQRIASEYVRVQVLKPTINFLLVDDDKEENEDEKEKEEQHPWQRKNEGDCQKGKDRPRLSFHLDDECVPSAHDKKGSVSLLQVPGSQKNAIPKESHQREWLSHHIQDAILHHTEDSPKISQKHPKLEAKYSSPGHRYDDVGINRRRSKILKTPSPSSRTLSYPSTRSHKPHELFVELDELQRSEQFAGIGASSIYWKEKARWIKFEEDREEGSGRWGKPHVASLTFNSLPQLRKGLEHGLVLLDIPETQLPAIFNTMVEGMLNAELIQPEQHGLALRMLHQSARKNPMEQTSLFQASVRRLSMYATSDSSRKTSLITPSPPVNNATALSPSIDNHANGADEVRISMLENNNNSNPDTPLSRRLTVHGDAIMRKIPAGAEAAIVMVATDDAFEDTVMTLVRLEEATVFENFLEVPTPLRFIFFMVGPSFADTDYHEIGRAMATLFSDEVFRDIAYTGLDKHDIMKGISEFLNDTMVLPPGDWDRDLLLPITRIQKKEQAKVMRRRQTLKPTKEDTEAVIALTKKMHMELNLDPLRRTGRIFGGLVNDVKRRYPHYWSDITDAFNFQCLAAFVFIYFACLSPAITFGGLLSEKTKKWMGVSEMIVSTSVCGMLFSLFSGQPLVIIGATGPLLVFEEQMSVFCETIGIELLPFRTWVGFWIFVISIVVVAFEGSILVRYFTRFTEEILTVLISLVFLYETYLGLYHTVCANPLLTDYCFSDGHHGDTAHESNHSSEANYTSFLLAADNYSSSSTFAGDYSQHLTTLDPQTTYRHTFQQTTGNIHKDPSCTYHDEAESFHGDTCSPGHWTPRPNTALLSIILTFGTFFIAYFLQILRNSSFLGRTSRRAMGNFGIAIAIILMVSLDYLIQNTYTQKLTITDGFIPTDPCKRGWLINPLGINYAFPVGAVFGAIVPAFLLFILLYMEILLTGQYVSKKEHKLRKGTGFHLDLFLMGALSLLASLFGLPWMCAGPVRTVSHLGSLSVLTRTEAPGVKPRLDHIKDQRMTNFAVSLLIGLTHFLAPVLREVPIAVLYGVFLYLGLSSLSGIQVIERIKILFMPSKHHPDKKFVRMVKAWKMHMFTLLQIVSLIVLWVIKTSIISMAFPFGLILLVLIRRKILGFFYTWPELEALDSEEEEHEGHEMSE